MYNACMLLHGYSQYTCMICTYIRTVMRHRLMKRRRLSQSGASLNGQALSSALIRLSNVAFHAGSLLKVARCVFHAC